MKLHFLSLFLSGVLGIFFNSQSMLAETRIVLEAEDAIDVQPPVLIIDASLPQKTKPATGASGNKYIEIAQGAGKPSEGGEYGNAVLKFKIDNTGAYYIWARCFWQDGCGNSFIMQINEMRPFTFGQDSTYGTWHWVKAPKQIMPIKLEKGEHKLAIRNREDGIRIDQFIITDDPRFIPVDIEEP